MKPGAAARWMLMAGLAALTGYGLQTSTIRSLGGAVVMQKALTQAEMSRPASCQPEPKLQAAVRQLAWVHDGPSDYLLAAVAEAQQGCASAALDWLAAGHARWPSDVPLAWRLGERQAAAGDAEAALEAWQAAPSIARRYTRIGRGAVETGEWAAALAAYTMATQVDPTLSEAFFGLGQTLAHGYARLEEALAAYDQARALDDPSPYLPVEIAHALSRLGRYAEARAEVDAHDQQGALANAIRGQAYAAEGDADRAAHFMALALSQSPNDPWFRWMLGVVYLQQGRLDEASAEWATILARYPDFAPAQGSAACLAAAAAPQDCLPGWAQAAN